MCRKYGDLFDQLGFMDIDDITKLTGCKKPCFYRRYSFLGDKHFTSFKSEFFTVSFCVASRLTMVETEELIYPLSSLVAEFGGTLGLFLGFSFMAVWDGLHWLTGLFARY